MTRMSTLYDALSKVKEQVTNVNFIIAQEEDTLKVLGNSLREQEAKNQSLTIQWEQFNLTAKLAESEYTVAFMESESLKRKLDELRNELDVCEKQFEMKDLQLSELKAFHASQEKMLIEYRAQSLEKYSSIPIIKTYMEASNRCNQLSQTLNKRTAELKKLQEEQTKLLRQSKNISAIPVSKTISAGSQPNVLQQFQMTLVPDSEIQSQPDQFGALTAMLSQLVEDNRLLRVRLEQLESKNCKPTDSVSPITPVPVITEAQAKKQAKTTLATRKSAKANVARGETILVTSLTSVRAKDVPFKALTTTIPSCPMDLDFDSGSFGKLTEDQVITLDSSPNFDFNFGNVDGAFF